MRVILQNVKTGRYLRHLNEWTDDDATAREFPDSLSAINYCSANGLSDVHVLLKFKQAHYDISLPVQKKDSLS